MPINTKNNHNISVQVICFVGGGGKTTAMFKLSEELKERGKSVILTTTTAIYKPTEEQYDALFLIDTKEFKLQIETGQIVVLGEKITNEGKLKGISVEKLQEIYFSHKNIDYILIEADGSKGRSIKAPETYEPVIPSFATKVVGLIGMDILGKEINDINVHRPHIFSRITDSKQGEIIDIQKIIKLILHKDGLFKGVPNQCEKYLLLNKVEKSEQIQKSKELATNLYDINLKNPIGIKKIIVTSFKNKKNYVKWSVDIDYSNNNGIGLFESNENTAQYTTK